MSTKFKRVVSWVESDGGGIVHRSFSGSSNILLLSITGKFSGYVF